jgi:hypothetical protein
MKFMILLPSLQTYTEYDRAGEHMIACATPCGVATFAGAVQSIPMRFSRPRLRALPLPLRLLLALALILNGAVVPPITTHAAMADGDGVTMSAHCHQHGAALSSGIENLPNNPCRCCTAGHNCQCGCVVALALPATFPDLRPLAPRAVATRLIVPEPAVAPPQRLLRPPIA